MALHGLGLLVLSRLAVWLAAGFSLPSFGGFSRLFGKMLLRHGFRGRGGGKTTGNFCGEAPNSQIELFDQPQVLS